MAAMNVRQLNDLRYELSEKMSRERRKMPLDNDNTLAVLQYIDQRFDALLADIVDNMPEPAKSSLSPREARNLVVKTISKRNELEGG